MSANITKHLVNGRQVLSSSMHVSLLHPDAEVPSRENETDVGLDITVVSRCDSRAEDYQQDVNTFATGLIIRPPRHYHVEIIAHPALYKAGYMLTGSPLIINPGNNEELILPLYKYKESEDLELPFRAAIAVLRITEYAGVAVEAGAAGKKQARAAPRREEEIEFVQSSKKTVKKQGKTNHMF